MTGKQDSCDQLDRVYQDVNDKLLLMREMEKASVKSMLIEERSRLCLFVSCLKPVMVSFIFISFEIFDANKENETSTILIIIIYSFICCPYVCL